MTQRPDFDAGDVVVCVDVGAGVHGHQCPLKRGGIYRVESLSYIENATVPGWCVEVEGVNPIQQSNGRDLVFAFRADRFRKVRKADDDFCAQMKALRPVKRRADA